MFKSKLKAIAIAALAAAPLSFAAAPAKAQETPLIGQLMLFAGNFCPRYWAEANGALLPISQNTALFSIIGTMYGGDGRTTMGLPDLRGRTPQHYGTGPGLSTYSMGQTSGSEDVTITVDQMPSHNHQVQAANDDANKAGPGNKYLAVPRDPNNDFFNIYWNGAPNRIMAPDMITDTGGNQPTDIRNPRLTMMWCIALVGIFPSRN